MFLVSSCSCLLPIQWSQALSREWRCSGSRDLTVWIISYIRRCNVLGKLVLLLDPIVVRASSMNLVSPTLLHGYTMHPIRKYDKVQIKNIFQFFNWILFLCRSQDLWITNWFIPQTMNDLRPYWSLLLAHVLFLKNVRSSLTRRLFYEHRLEKGVRN